MRILTDTEYVVTEPAGLLPVGLGLKSTCTKKAQENSVYGNSCFVK
jgi:hypothetical protein